MKNQFDVWRFDFPKKGEHPVVLISHPDLCARAAVVDVLFCTSQRQNRKAYPHEVMLIAYREGPFDTGRKLDKDSCRNGFIHKTQKNYRYANTCRFQSP